MAASAAEVKSFYDQWMEKIQKKAEEAVGEAVKKAYARYFALAKTKIEEIFQTAVEHFYNSEFHPSLYERRFSMREVLQTKLTQTSLSVSFDPSGMTYRSGYGGEDGLYSLVFREGWHGGAKRGAGHPDAPAAGISAGSAQGHGAPYWRTPHPYYSRWGSVAEREAEAPLAEIRRTWADYEENQMQRDFKPIVDDELQNMKIRWY